MPNTFFKFKNFTINQAQSAMPVTTDACLFGALINPENARTVLDIGTGTGLLCLMLKQKSLHNATFLGIDIHQPSVTQANQNFANNRFAHQATAIFADATTYVSPTPFDLIISNPPFFNNHLLSGQANRNLALHAQTLNAKQLVNSCVGNAHNYTQIYIMAEPHFADTISEQFLLSNFHPNQLFNIYSNRKKPQFRKIISFSKENNTPIEEDIYIHSEFGVYSARFTQLLKPYYLFL